MSAEQTPDIEAVLVAAMHAECPLSGAECQWLTDPDGDPACLPEYVVPLAGRLAEALAPVLATAVREAEQRALQDAANADGAPRRGYDAWSRWLWMRADRLHDRADRVAVDAPEGGEGR